jgi:hypothetical protein
MGDAAYIWLAEVAAQGKDMFSLSHPTIVNGHPQSAEGLSSLSTRSPFALSSLFFRHFRFLFSFLCFHCFCRNTTDLSSQHQRSEGWHFGPRCTRRNGRGLRTSEEGPSPRGDTVEGHHLRITPKGGRLKDWTDLQDGSEEQAEVFSPNQRVVKMKLSRRVGKVRSTPSFDPLHRSKARRSSNVKGRQRGRPLC